MSAPWDYPETSGLRNQWITARRGPKTAGLDSQTPYAFLWEEEPGADRTSISTATVFLTNRECPYRCLMCDLWRDTLDSRVPSGAITAQIHHALARLPSARQIKLYNAGSFFDPQAIPLEDYAEIADAVKNFERVIVECHPKLVSERTWQFQELLVGQLEVAVGLETAHPDVLARLNKQFTVADFARAAESLARHGVDLRVFLLVRPPFLTEAEGVFWAKRSLDTAFDAGASVCCLIPTRGGNGAMEALAATGNFAPPSLRSVEAAQEHGLALRRGRVFADLWNVEGFYSCVCSPMRAARLAEMNRTQRICAGIVCDLCG